MTDPLHVEPLPTLPERLAAGRRAALSVLVQNATSTAGATPETYTGVDVLLVNGMDIGPGIDAAVMETIVGGGRAVTTGAVVEATLIRELEWLLAEAKAGRVRAAVWAFLAEGEHQRIGHGWHIPPGRQWAVTAALDRVGSDLRKVMYG